MLLSVILISYNEAEYLREAVESCLAQRGIDNFEIIIADDGSTDGSKEIICEYVKRYAQKVRYIEGNREDGVQNPSIRVSNNIKKAMRIATGKYFVCLSGDDYFCDRNKFYKQTEFLEKNSKYVAIASNYKYVWEDHTEQVQNWNGVRGNLFWSGEYAHISCFMFRRSVYEHGLLEHFCDDVGLIYSIASVGKWYYEKDVMFAYRQRQGSIMHTDNQYSSQLSELLVLQDILSCPEHTILKSSTWSRYAKPLYYVWRHHNEKVNDGSLFEIGWLKALTEEKPLWKDKLKIIRWLCYSRVCWLVYFPLRKINKWLRGVLCR